MLRPGRTGGARLVWPIVTVLLWLLIGGPLGSFAGRLAEVQQNDNAAFLPESAEATDVVELQTRFAGDDSIPAVVVFESQEVLDPSALRAIGSATQALGGIDGIQQVSPPIPSRDGLAVQVVVPIDGGVGDRITEIVAEMRSRLAAADIEAEVYVTGPGGVLGDFVEAFAAIDGLLLVVALSVVLVILLLVYRSPVLPFVVLLSALLGLGVASAVTYALADRDVLDLNGQSQGILFILVIGAATDYALLLVARFREELRERASRFAAMRTAYRGAVEPIAASGVTVILGLLCLLLSNLSSNRGLGPVGAIGVAGAMLASLTFLPAALVLLGRAAFWPFRPRLGSDHPEVRGIWGKVSRVVAARPRTVWVATAMLLAGAAAFVPTLKDEAVPQTEIFLTEVESVTGQDVLGDHFPGGAGSPAVVIGPADRLRDLVQVVSATEGVASVVPFSGVPTDPSGGPVPPPPPPRVVAGQVLLEATLSDPADSAAAEQTVAELRERLDDVSAEALVGGTTAIQLDTESVTTADRNRIIPAILAVIFVVLALLLRALIAPLLLIVANVLSFGATLGVSAVLFNTVFGFPGVDPTVTLIAFVFLVALGIDYSIFLMTRAREEALRQDTRPGMTKALAVTGGVITSAGIVLAATFSALGVVPILFLAQIAFLVAFGVLLDTFVVRSLLVPALVHDIGRPTWWPSRLARASTTTAPGKHRSGVPVDDGRREG